MAQKFMDTEFDVAFEATAELKNLTAANLSKIPFMDMLKILEPLVLVEVPEVILDGESKRRFDYLLARLANVHAYLQYLWSAATYERARLKAANASSAEDMAKKKEAIYALASAVKLKYEAVSRKITLVLDGEGDPKVVERRSYKAPGPSPYDASVDRRTANAPRTGGWNSVG
jgi:hypothetical protein